MPKIVDPQERRARIADAVFALIERGGVQEASLRNVAAAAGLNIGSVRHYVDGHEGMLVVAVHEMARRVEARIEAEIAAFDSRPPGERGDRDDEALGEHAIDLLEQLLPLDAERRREVVVWLAFCEWSRVTPALAAQARVLIDASRRLTRPMLAAAGVPPGALEPAAESLAAAVDGLAIALLHDPDRLSHQQRRAILRVQLAASLSWR